MDSLLLVLFQKNYKNKIMDSIKDSIANVTTIGATGMVMFNWNEVLTMGLLVTGLILNIQRIYANNNTNNKKKD